MVSEERKYSVLNTEQAKVITNNYLISKIADMKYIEYGLPEVYDRYNVWSVPVRYKNEVIQ